MRLLFKSVIAKKAIDNWPMGFYGCSVIDSENYAISTHYLKANEVPVSMQDSKTSSELIAGLLNAFYTGRDASKMSEEEIRRLGTFVPSEDVPEPDPNQTSLPF